VPPWRKWVAGKLPSHNALGPRVDPAMSAFFTALDGVHKASQMTERHDSHGHAMQTELRQVTANDLRSVVAPDEAHNPSSRKSRAGLGRSWYDLPDLLAASRMPGLYDLCAASEAQSIREWLERGPNHYQSLLYSVYCD